MVLEISSGALVAVAGPSIRRARIEFPVQGTKARSDFRDRTQFAAVLAAKIKQRQSKRGATRKGNFG
jgi:hypothetical protein